MLLDQVTNPVKVISVNGHPATKKAQSIAFDKGMYHTKLLGQLDNMLHMEVVSDVEGVKITCIMDGDHVRLFEEVSTKKPVCPSQTQRMLQDLSEAKYMEHSFRGALERISMSLGMTGSPNLAVDVPREVEKKLELLRQADKGQK